MRDLIRARLLESDDDSRRLPDESQLQVEYRVGRNAVRAALAELQREGLISRTQGAGTFPVLRKTRHTLEEAHGVAHSIVSPHTRVSSRALSVEHLPAPAVVAARLDVHPGTPCLAVDIVTTIDGKPALVLTSYLADPVARANVAEIVRHGHWTGDWYDVLTAAGLEPRRRDVLVEAVPADELLAPHLQLSVGAPIMRFERRLVLGDDHVREYGFSSCRGDVLVFAMSDRSFASEAVVS